VEVTLSMRPHHMNDAFLMKMMWNLITKPNDRWCKILHGKYGRNNDLRVTINFQSYDSPLWKALPNICINFSRILCNSNPLFMFCGIVP
jgi:hypothetical protein